MKTDQEELKSQLELLAQLRATHRRIEESAEMLRKTIDLNSISFGDREPLDENEEECLRTMNAKLKISEEDYLSLTREQVVSAARVMARNLQLERAEVGDYLGLKFPHIFIGIEKDGYAHS